MFNLKKGLLQFLPTLKDGVSLQGLYEVNYYLDDVNITDNFIEYVAYGILEVADWQDLTTLLNEYDFVESYNEWIENI